MKKFQIIFVLLTSFSAMSQYNTRDSNRIGLSGGLTQMSVFTDNFNATPEQGWTAGLSLRGNFYNNFQMAYGMHFTESKFSLASTLDKKIEYKLSAVQIFIVGSYQIIKDHLTIELGPVLQVNGDLKIDKDDELLLLKDNPLLSAADITPISTISGNVYGGITAGIKNVRLHVAYQYGVTNFLNNLNKTEELKLKNKGDFNGHLGLLSGMVSFYL